MTGKHTHISRGIASRGRLLAQGGLIVVLAVTALAWWKWSGEAHEPLPPLSLDPAGDAPSAPSGSKASRRSADLAAVSDSLLAVSNAFRAPAAEAPAEEVPISTPTTNGNADDPVRFLGLIQEGERRLALLSIEGTQRVVAEGAEYAAGATLLGATPDAATIQDDAGRRRIALAARSGPKTSVGVVPFVIAAPPPTALGRTPQASDTEARRAAAAERMRANRELFERRRLAEQAGTVAEEQGEQEGQR